MVIVCAEGNQQNMMYFNAERDNNGTPDWKYEDYFFNELIPYIEKTYRVRTDKGGRAIGGFSMGGGAATVYGVHHPEYFCMIYDISGYLRRQPLSFLKNDPSAAWRQQVIENNNPIVRVNSGTAEDVAAWKKTDWKIAVGDKDFTLEANMDLMKAFREKGVPCSMYVNDGAHDAKWVNSVLEDVLKRANKNFKSL
jgi:enterochelin esterase-like enzyme